VVTVYASIYDWQAFTTNEVVDEKVGIRLPIHEIFA
jgi:hypothetical protein